MSEDSFILMNLKDSKEIAAAMQNETAQKILDFLTKDSATESDIAKGLSIPISTVHYNLQQLKKAKLVKADEYHYSKKGKEVLHYKLAKKLIIIAPSGEENNWKELLKKVIPALGITALIGVLFRTFYDNLTTNKIPPPEFMARESAVMLMADSAGVASELSFWQKMNSFEWFIIGAITTIAILLIMELIAQKGWFKLKKH